MATAIWMMASRAGPFLLGWIAVATLKHQEYGSFVLAFAWVNAMVGICLGLFPTLAARAANEVNAKTYLTAHLIKLGVQLIAGLALIIVASVLFAGPTSTATVWHGLATGWASLAVGCSCLLSIISWSLGQGRSLVGLALLESILHAIWLVTCGILAWNTSVIMLGLGVISATVSIWFLLTLSRTNPSLLRQLSSAKKPDTPMKLASIVGPNLINSVAMSVTPALALVIAVARTPDLDIEVIFGLAMLWVSAGLFPIQVLMLKLSQKLVQLRTTSEEISAYELNATELASLGLGGIWGIGLAGIILWLGPIAVGNFKMPFAQLLPHLWQVAWIAGGLAFLASVGPILQAQHRYTTWSAINVFGCFVLLCYAGFGILSPATLLYGMSLSVLSRCIFAAPLLSASVKR
ncbi:MAG: hypothetical protein CFE32_05210 [Alphaproteobacteria bacterium PA3]|nr:MAG: hypothetical protein CFE32_05210 [Alphaproteobacteria bacterium PA3]